VQVIRAGEPVAPGACITLGNFDGVHLAHQVILRELQSAARKVGTQAGLVTFEPSPQVFFHKNFPFILTPFAEKQERLAALSLDFMYVITFNDALRRIPAARFLKQMILKPLRPRRIVVGHDHRFGSDRAGDAALLAGAQAAGQFELEVIPEYERNGAPVKSTRIRERLVLGAVRDAAELLGYRYAIRGRVVRGQKFGTRLGFPTVNVEPEAPEKLIPATGVYAVTVQRGAGEKPLSGAMNIGFRPTTRPSPRSQATGGSPAVDRPTLEVHILDFSGELYGAALSVELVERLRPERRFDSFEDLKNQIAADVALTRIILTEAGKQGPWA
jgi:riboflavin kinase/FMN adenylyltransferase